MQSIPAPLSFTMVMITEAGSPRLTNLSVSRPQSVAYGYCLDLVLFRGAGLSRRFPLVALGGGEKLLRGGRYPDG